MRIQVDREHGVIIEGDEEFLRSLADGADQAADTDEPVVGHLLTPDGVVTIRIQRVSEDDGPSV